MLNVTIDAKTFLLRRATVPAGLIDNGRFAGDVSETCLVDLHISDGKIIDLFPSDAAAGPLDADTPMFDLQRSVVLPCFVEAHAHLDKTQLWDRAPNKDGSFAGALATFADEALTVWSARDLRARMEFGLRCGYAYGTRAIRTHLDSGPAQRDTSWGVFRELRVDWRDRMALQAVALIGLDHARDEPATWQLAQLVQSSGGVFGAFTPMVPDFDVLLNRLFDIADVLELDLDFHADETGDPNSVALDRIARTVLQRGFSRAVTVGHCCSLAVQPDDAAARTLDLVAKANISVVSLPACNLYLQDRAAGRTPRWRGVTLLHEMRARGIPVAFGGDNCRDAFHAYGDYDMAEVFRDAVRIAHLDNPIAGWAPSVTSVPARILGETGQGLAPGQAADLVIFDARNFGEMLARPRGGRTVMRQGRIIDSTLPSYSDLDFLMEPT